MRPGWTPLPGLLGAQRWDGRLVVWCGVWRSGPYAQAKAWEELKVPDLDGALGSADAKWPANRRELEEQLATYEAQAAASEAVAEAQRAMAADLRARLSAGGGG